MAGALFNRVRAKPDTPPYVGCYIPEAHAHPTLNEIRLMQSRPKLCCRRSRISLRRYRTISLSQTLLSTDTKSVPLFIPVGWACATITGSRRLFQTFTI